MLKSQDIPHRIPEYSITDIYHGEIRITLALPGVDYSLSTCSNFDMRIIQDLKLPEEPEFSNDSNISIIQLRRFEQQLSDFNRAESTFRAMVEGTARMLLKEYMKKRDKEKA